MFDSYTKEQLKDCLNYDVIVIGCGPAGFIAALAAADLHCKVAVIESGSFPLSNIIQAPLEALMTYHKGKQQVIGGLADQFIEKCLEMGSCSGYAPDSTGYCSSIVSYSPDLLKVTAFEMLETAGVDLYLQTSLSRVQMDSDRIELIVLQSRTETILMQAKTYIDCSGDGDLIYATGCDYSFGDENNEIQPMSSLLKLGGVDMKSLRSYVIQNPNDFRFFSEEARGKVLFNEFSAKLHLWGFKSCLKDGFQSGRLSLRRNEIQLMESYWPGEVILNFARTGVGDISAKERSKAQAKVTRQNYELYLWLKSTIPAFEHSWFQYSGVIGMREGRRLNGQYTLTEEDVMQGKRFEDTIALSIFPIDIHNSSSSSMECHIVENTYSIPLRSLLPKNIKNMIVAGRCIDCTHKAQASIRITATAMATGQAAGVFAGLLSLSPNEQPPDYSAVRQTLLKQNAILNEGN